MAAIDPLRHHREPLDVARVGYALVDDAVTTVCGLPATVPLTTRVAHLLRPLDPTRAEEQALATALVVLLDHGLTASTVAARVAASARASVHECLLAAYATMAGTLHGGAPRAAHELLADADAHGPERALDLALRRHGRVPGFGHVVYEGADPRAELVLERVWSLGGAAALRDQVTGLAGLTRARTGAEPNLDLALAALGHALGWPPEAGEVVFQVARSFGVIAHVIEEYAEEPLRWRGRQAEG